MKGCTIFNDLNSKLQADGNKGRSRQSCLSWWVTGKGLREEATEAGMDGITHFLLVTVLMAQVSVWSLGVRNDVCVYLWESGGQTEP